MRSVRIPESLVDEMRRHARETYPDECCGFLVALAEPPSATGPRSIVSVRRTANDFEGERRRRFVIRPQELRAAERSVESTSRLIGGFYHSHPDHPARPSAFDQEHAWPWYTYLVISVTATSVPAVGAFELDPESGEFREVPLEVGRGDDAEVSESLRAPGGR
ncbi:MAG: M67 family metallopeptidase [Thermoplasmata archaeon]